MEPDKENVIKWNENSRIPLRVGSLPKHLSKTSDSRNEHQRIPLKTINCPSNLAGSSRIHGKVAPSKQNKNTLVIDAKYVTVRENTEELDWDHKVFKDETDDKDISVVSISDYSDKEKILNNDIKNKVTNRLLQEKRADTPHKSSPLEVNRVRNIKRSLTRPHSRELQGLSPLGPSERKGEEKYKRRLNFDENYQDKLQPPAYIEKLYTKRVHKDYANDLFPYLLSAERPGQVPVVSSIHRACLLNWLMKVNGPEGNPATVQAASWYFDSVAAVSTVQVEMLQRVSAACYWIAQKINGPGVKASRLVRCSGNAFTSIELTLAERAILQKLKFPRQPIVPQDFITYLSWCSNHARPGEIEVAATFLCMCGLMVDKTFCTELPSVIAAASVRNALIAVGCRDSILRIKKCPIFQAIEKKAHNMCTVCSVLRKAVRTVSQITYEYKAALDIYGAGPHFIAQKVVNFANDLAIVAACTTKND